MPSSSCSLVGLCPSEVFAPCVLCTNAMHAYLQVTDDDSISRAVAAARPRQALALTLAHWELATKTSCTLGRLSPTMGDTPLNPAAGSLLMLSSLVSKASCCVHQPLPDQAMDAWQHAPWPTGDTDLLCMGLVLAADPALQSFVDKLGAQQESNAQSQTQGKLQQAVTAAATLLSEVAGCAYNALPPAMATEDEGGEESPRSAQSEGLHPAVVGSLAVRAFQLSDGNPTAAMAFLVASVLPEWELDLPRAQQGEASPAKGQANGSDGDMSPAAASARRARQRSYRKRARSVTRCAPYGVTYRLSQCHFLFVTLLSLSSKLHMWVLLSVAVQSQASTSLLVVFVYATPRLAVRSPPFLLPHSAHPSLTSCCPTSPHPSLALTINLGSLSKHASTMLSCLFMQVSISWQKPP